NRLGPSAARGNGAPAWIACQRVTNIGVRRLSSTHSASSLLVAGSSSVATVAAMRNLAGRFSATSRYHASAPRIAGSSQTFSLAKSRMNRLSVLYLFPGGVGVHVGHIAISMVLIRH